MMPFELDHRTIQACDYALINPLQVDGAMWSDLPSEPLVPHRYESQSHLFPRLVIMRRLELRDRINLLDRSEWWTTNHGTSYFSGLLQSSVAVDWLKSHLCKQMDQYDPNRGAHDVLRLHDPRVFRHLCWILKPDQWECLLGPVDMWAWPDSRGWLARARTRSVTMAVASRVRPSPSQWQKILELGELNANLRHLLSVMPKLVDDEDLAKRVIGLQTEAKEVRGLSDADDRRCYVEQAIRFGASIHTHPELRVRLEQARAGEISYIGACVGVDVASLRQISDADFHSIQG